MRARLLSAQAGAKLVREQRDVPVLSAQNWMPQLEKQLPPAKHAAAISFIASILDCMRFHGTSPDGLLALPLCSCWSPSSAASLPTRKSLLISLLSVLAKDNAQGWMHTMQLLCLLSPFI